MDVRTALEAIENNKTLAGHLIYDEPGANVLLGVTEKALTSLTPEDEGFEEAIETRDKMRRLITAFKVIHEYNQSILTTFPLMFSLEDFIHPEEGIIVTPLEEALNRVQRAGNWPQDMPGLPEVLQHCIDRLLAIRTRHDGRNANLVTYVPLKFFTVIVGNAYDHPLLKQLNVNKKPKEADTYLVLGLPNLA